MPSSISNSKVIPRALLVCAVTLGLFEAVIRAGLLAPGDGTSLAADNYIRAQRFIYCTNSSSAVTLVGSSLMANLHSNYFPMPISNIAQAGGSSMTGLRLINHAISKPSVVLIEMDDTITRPTDTELLAGLLGNPLYALRWNLWMMRRDYQPVKILCGYLKRHKVQSAAPSAADREPYMDPSVRANLIEMAVQSEGNGLSAADSAAIRKSAEEIHEEIAALKGQSIRVMLVQIPCDPRVDGTMREKQVKTLLHQIFRGEDWLPEIEGRTWSTRDGVHLVVPDAKYFASYVSQFLQSNLTASTFGPR
jgi:hypothetical protein